MCTTVPGRKAGMSRGSHKNVSFSTCQKICSCPFCVASVALRDIRRVTGGICVRDRPWQKSWHVDGGSHKKVSFSTCQKMCSCRFAWQA